MNTQQKALDLILRERQNQDDKWGEQNHLPVQWHLIAAEEMGEIAQALLQNKSSNYRDELVQAAAVMLAWLECEIRNGRR